MSRAAATPPCETIADLLESLGGIAPARVRLHPPPGAATERDLVTLNARKDGLYELVDSVIVAKVMGYPEATLALWLGYLLQDFLQTHDLGVLAGADGAIRLMPHLVRLPDLSFVSWDRLPERGKFPTEPILALAPDLAIEVLTEGNTQKEMNRKLREYFAAGVRLIWYIEPTPRIITVYTSTTHFTTLTENDVLEGGGVLPGLQLPLTRIFSKSAFAAQGRKGKPDDSGPRKK